MHIKYEQKPNKNIHLFDYHHGGHLKTISLKDRKEHHSLGWLEFDEHPGKKLLVTSSNGKTVEYHFFQGKNDEAYLETVSSPDIPETKYDYDKKGVRYYVSRVNRRAF